MAPGRRLCTLSDAAVTLVDQLDTVAVPSAGPSGDPARPAGDLAGWVALIGWSGMVISRWGFLVPTLFVGLLMAWPALVCACSASRRTPWPLSGRARAALPERDVRRGVAVRSGPHRGVGAGGRPRHHQRRGDPEQLLRPGRGQPDAHPGAADGLRPRVLLSIDVLAMGLRVRR